METGIESVDAALGDPKAISPFFRIPGLGRTNAIEGYLASKSLVTWSADVVADDWKTYRCARDRPPRDAAAGGERPRHPAPARHPSGDGACGAHPAQGAEGTRLPCRSGRRSGERPASVPELLGAPEYNKEGWPRVVKASVSRETPTKVALRHRAKNDATTKRRRSAVAGQHESNGTDYWKQNQSNWFGQPRGLATSF